MAGYMMNEALFEPPPGWIDGSLTALRPRDDVDDLKLMVMRATAGTESLESFSARQTKMLSQRLSWFAVLSERMTTVAEGAAHSLRATFKDSGHELYQHRIIFAHRAQFLTLVVVARVAATAKCDALLEQVLSSLRFRDAASGSAPAGDPGGPHG